MSEQEAEVTMKAIAEAAQCWCDPETSHIAMDEKLAHAFSHRIQSHLATEEVLRRESHRLRADNEIMKEALNTFGNNDNWKMHKDEPWFRAFMPADHLEILDPIEFAQDALRRVGELK